MLDLYLTIKANTKKCLMLLALTGAFAAMVPGQSYAGGWPVRKGRLLTSLSFSYFRANNAWDSTGTLRNYPGGGYFQSQGVALYGEYGISRRVTGVASVGYVANQVKQGDFKVNYNGLSDAELGLRFYLTNINFKYYIALQATAIIPLYSGQTLGLGSPGNDVSLVASSAGKKFYFTVQGGGRLYYSPSGPRQVRYNGLVGYNIDTHNQISLGASGVLSYSTNKQFSTNIVQNRDFQYHMASLSYGYLATHDLSFFLTLNQFVYGRNTGRGTNIAFSVSRRF